MGGQQGGGGGILISDKITAMHVGRLLVFN